MRKLLLVSIVLALTLAASPRPAAAIQCSTACLVAEWHRCDQAYSRCNAAAWSGSPYAEDLHCEADLSMCEGVAELLCCWTPQ